MSDKESELQFLQIVRVNGNIYHLTLIGLSYLDIVKKMSDYSKKGIIAVHRDGTSLTPKGNEYMKALYKELGKNGIERFLSPAFEHKIESLSKESIYIPTSIDKTFSH